MYVMNLGGERLDQAASAYGLQNNNLRSPFAIHIPSEGSSAHSSARGFGRDNATDSAQVAYFNHGHKQMRRVAKPSGHIKKLKS